MKTKEIDLTNIRLDGGTQIREQINRTTVEHYRELIIDGTELPPVEVFDDGDSLWLADGFHRWHATDEAGLRKLKCNVRKGSQRDAILFAVGANAVHGLARSNADKRRAVMTLLNDDEWSGWSDNRIAKECGVSCSFVGDIRRSIFSPPKDGARKVERNGTIYEQKTSNIGKTTTKEIFDADTGEVIEKPMVTTITEKPFKKSIDNNSGNEQPDIGVRLPSKHDKVHDLFLRLDSELGRPSSQISVVSIRALVAELRQLVL